MTPMTSSVPRLLLCFLVAIAILPAAAQADTGLPQVPVPASDALTTAAHALAVAHWGVEPVRRPGHRDLGAHGRRASTPARTWMSYDIHNPATYIPVRDQLQPGRRLGLAQALHGHRA